MGSKKQGRAFEKMMVVAGPNDREVELRGRGQALMSFERLIHLHICTFY